MRTGAPKKFAGLRFAGLHKKNCGCAISVLENVPKIELKMVCKNYMKHLIDI
jgi:hypothetical protein